MARWIPTKKQKYGVGEFVPHPAAAKFARSGGTKLAQSWAAWRRRGRTWTLLPLPWLRPLQPGGGRGSQWGNSLRVWGTRVAKNAVRLRDGGPQAEARCG